MKEPAVRVDFRNGKKLGGLGRLLLQVLLFPGGFSIGVYLERDSAHPPRWFMEQVEGFKTLVPDGYEMRQLWRGPNDELATFMIPEN